MLKNYTRIIIAGILIFIVLLLTVFLITPRNDLDKTLDSLGSPGDNWTIVEETHDLGKKKRTYIKEENFNPNEFNQIIENISYESPQDLAQTTSSKFESSCATLNRDVCTATFNIIFAGALGEKHITINMYPESSLYPRNAQTGNNRTYLDVEVSNDTQVAY